MREKERQPFSHFETVLMQQYQEPDRPPQVPYDEHYFGGTPPIEPPPEAPDPNTGRRNLLPTELFIGGTVIGACLFAIEVGEPGGMPSTIAAAVVTVSSGSELVRRGMHGWRTRQAARQQG